MVGSTTEEFEAYLSRHAPIAATAHFAAGDLVGEWRLTALLGQGGGGEVYRAERTTDGMAAAIKLHVPDSDASEARQSASRQRFERERQLLSENPYPFFPSYYGGGEVRGCPYFAMELLSPVTLPSGDSAVASLVLQVASAVRVLHLRGLVHRDIKPQNIMRRANGELVLIDLGLVKGFSLVGSAIASSVTMVDGKVVGAGSPRYAAPEQFNGGVISPATDIHALGMLADVCFHGHPPRDWERIISRATSTIAERRYADVESFVRAIRRRHYARLAAWLGGGLLALLVLFWLGYRVSGGALGTAVADRWHWHQLAANVATNVVIPELLYERLSTNEFGMVQPVESVWRNVTYAVPGTVLRLNRQRHAFARPLSLDPGCHYWIVGPGTLDATIDGPPGAVLHLDNCVLVNRTRKTLQECGVKYVFLPGASLNFINRTDNYERRHPYIEDFDGAFNALRYQGSETKAEMHRWQADDKSLMKSEYDD